MTFTEPTGLGNLVERRVMFADGTDVDLVPVPIERMEQVISHEGALPVLARGYRTLIDKDGRFQDLPARVAGADPMALRAAALWPADPADVINEIHSYLYHCAWTTRKLRRGELSVAIECHNGLQAGTLRRFVEWQAKARGGSTLNTYYGGRFLEQWAVPETVAALGATQARHDPEDLARSIIESLDLFASLAGEVANELAIEYPRRAQAWTREYLRETLGHRISGVAPAVAGLAPERPPRASALDSDDGERSLSPSQE